MGVIGEISFSSSFFLSFFLLFFVWFAADDDD